MEFSEFVFLLPLKFYLSIFNSILTVILNSGINLLFNKRGGLNHGAYNFLKFVKVIFYLDNNIICGSYWKRKKEFVSYLAYLIPSIINFFIIFICTLKEKDILRFYYILYFIIQIHFIYLFVSDKLILEIIGISFLILSINTFFFHAYILLNILKDKDQYNQSSFELIEIFCSFFCYGGWFLFGLIIGDIFCIISHGLLFLIFLFSFKIRCWIKYTNKNERNENDEEEFEEELTSNENE